MKKVSLVLVVACLFNALSGAAFADQPYWAQKNQEKKIVPQGQSPLNLSNGPKKFFGWTKGKHLGWAKQGKHLGVLKK